MDKKKRILVNACRPLNRLFSPKKYKEIFVLISSQTQNKKIFAQVYEKYIDVFCVKCGNILYLLK